MSALASLSKFQGRYDKWLAIRHYYNLKWSSGNNSLQALERFFNPTLNLDDMIARIREMIRVLPAHMSEVMKFAVITGLRPSEDIEAVKILNSGNPSLGYYNQERQCLEHFRFPNVFLRATKKAYLSFITLDNLQPILNLGPKTPTWPAIRWACNRRKLRMDMRLCRKVYASWLIQSAGIDSITVDMLQGRCPPNILARHYQSPDSSLCNRVLDAVNALMKEIYR